MTSTALHTGYALTFNNFASFALFAANYKNLCVAVW
jgi:hypothetical protein